MNLAFDIDGCIADFSTAYKKRLLKITGEDYFQSTWTPNDITVWDWDVEAGYTKDQIAATWESILADGLFWEKLKPIPGAVEAMNRVNVLSKEHSVYFITNRSGRRCKQQTEKFLYDIGINYPTVLLASNKLPILQALKIDFFVDDKLETMVETRKLGKQHFYLLETGYNQTGRPTDMPVATDVKDALEKAGLW